MLETVVSKENGIRAAADGDVATLRLFIRQFHTPLKHAEASPEHAVPTVQWSELTTTLFREAIENGRLAVVQELLASFVVKELNASPREKQRLLSRLLAWAIRDDYSEIVECLLGHDADPNAPIFADDDEEDDDLPLSLAARLGSLDIAELLLTKGASVNARRESDGSTALHEAARQDEREMIQMLVQHGAEIHAVDHCNGETPLHVAVKRGNKAAVTMLLQCRADPTRTNKRGSSAEHLARVEGHDAVLQLLVDATRSNA